MILDAVATKQAAEEGIALVEANTNEAWREVAFRAGVITAKYCDTFTADQIWETLDSMEDVPPVHNKSAMGPILRRLLREGVIEDTGMFERSIRPATHGKPLPVWRAV